MSSPSIGGKLLENAQEVRFSDDATRISHRNDSNFPKRAGNANEPGRLSFAYFSLAKQRKVRPAAGKQTHLERKNYDESPYPSRRYAHPKIFAGILARRSNEKDIKTIESLGIETIDLVVVNLYPFFEKQNLCKDEKELLEYIDIGGPSLIRAAGKNYYDVLVIGLVLFYCVVCY